MLFDFHYLQERAVTGLNAPGYGTLRDTARAVDFSVRGNKDNSFEVDRISRLFVLRKQALFSSEGTSKYSFSP